MTERHPKDKPALMVFSDDWGRHPSSCQHLIRRLLPTHRTWWVNTIGMRRPRLDGMTFSRGWEKVRHWFRPPKDTTHLPANLKVLHPRMWPYFSRPHDRRFNRLLLTEQLLPVIESCRSPVVAVTTVPVVADLVGRLPVERWVYYCVDDFSEWPGLDEASIESMEEKLVRRADVLISVSEALQDRLAHLGRASHLLTHGVDLDHWKCDEPLPPPAELAHLQRPLVLFWGVVDRRMDVQFIHSLATDLDRGTIVLVGPESDPDPVLLRPKRVARLEEVPFGLLPRLAREAAVLVMPYADLPVTRAIQPLKLKEYLATGKPVVVRDLPATRAWADALDLARTADEFSAAVRYRLAEGVPDLQIEARKRLAQESWKAKARQFDEWALHLDPT